MKTKALLCVCVLALSGACSSVGHSKQGSDASVPAGEFTLATNPDALELTIAGQGTVAVDLTRGEGFTDTVALTVTGLPSGVTSMFSTASLADGTDTTDLTLTVADTASAGTSSITITGTTPALTKTATLELTLATVNVAGTVRGGAANVTVRLVGRSATVTDSNGKFAYTDVKVPYDIYVIGQEGGVTPRPAVNYYKALTRPDPVLTPPTPALTIVEVVGSSTTIDGTKTGGNNTDPQFFLWSTGGDMVTGGGANTYSSIVATWSPQAPTKSGTLYGMQITRGALDVPIGYPGFGERNATLAAGVNSNTVNLAYVAPATATLTGTITPPTNFSTPALTLTQQLGPRSAPLWTATTTNANSLIPVLGSVGKSALHAISSLSGSTTQVVFPALAANTDVNFALRAPPDVTGPANNATNVTATTPFEFTVIADAVYQVNMTSTSANFHVFTKTGSVTIPNVSELPIPSATSFSWNVRGYGPVTHVNGAADAAQLEGVFAVDFEGPMHFLMSVPTRSFTTQ